MNQRALGAFYFNGGVREIIPIYPLYAIMFWEHGVTPFGLSLLFVIWCVASLAAEIPSGALADRFSRKWLIIASSFFKSGAYLTWYLEPHFTGYATGFILWGVGSALRSGAWEALLYDTLRQTGEETRFTRYHGRINALQTSGGFVGELAGGLLIVYGFSTVLLVSMVVPLIAAIPFLLYVSDTPREASEEGHYLAMLREGLIEAKENLMVRYLCLATICLMVSFGVYDEYVTPYLFETGFSLSVVAFLSASVMLTTALGEYSAEHFNQFGLTALLGGICLSGIFLLSAYFSDGLWVAVAIAIYSFLFAVAGVQFDARLQDAIEGDARATVTSVVGFAESGGAIIWFLAFGAISEINMATASATLAGVTIVAAVALMLMARIWQVPEKP